jgi:hypothetical protein
MHGLSMAGGADRGSGRMSAVPLPLPSLEKWLAEFRQCHASARDGQLEPEECHWYETARRELARLLLNAQQISREFGHTARQAIRIAWALQVELTLDDQAVRAVTLDISTGGFSALLGSAPAEGDAIDFSLRLPRTQPIAGTARVVAAVEKTSHVRVSFAFAAIAAHDREKLEMFLFDKVLSHLAA